MASRRPHPCMVRHAPRQAPPGLSPRQGELTWAAVRPVYSPPALLVWFLAPVLWATGETNELTNQLVLAGVGLPLGLWLWWRGKGCLFEGRDDYLAVTVFLAMWAGALRALAYGANL